MTELPDPFAVPAEKGELNSPEPPNLDENKPETVSSDDYDFVRMPDGTVRAVRKSDITDVSELPLTSRSEAPRTAVVEKPVQHFYVWLANGDIERVAEEDLPTGSGTNAPQGFWQKNGKVLMVVGIHPIEDSAL
jgi:hypothetical protein